MNNSKPNIITDYDKLDTGLKSELYQFHPNGFGDAIFEFTNNKKKTIKAIRWETADRIYLLRISNKMLNKILENEGKFDNNY